MAERVPVVDFRPRMKKPSAIDRGGYFHNHDQRFEPQPPPPAYRAYDYHSGAWHAQLFPTPTTNWYLNPPTPTPVDMGNHPYRPGPVRQQQNMTRGTANPNNKRTRAESPSLSTAIPLPKRQKLTKSQRRAQAVMEAMTKSALEEPVDYSDLKAWIAAQEALPVPVPLTAIQKKAIADLKNSIKSAPVLTSEPEIGGKDWVSLLHRYRDAHQEIGVTVDFHEDSGPNLRWMCHCIIKSTVMNEYQQPMDRRFPELNFGFVPMGADGGLRQPTFARKKDAKQYAAKCCVDFLMKENLMPLDGESVSFPKPKVAPQQSKKKKQQQSVAPQSPNTVSAEAKTTLSGSLTSSQKSALSGAADKPTHASKVHDFPISTGGEAETALGGGGGGAFAEVADEEIPATMRVRELCERLGIHAPTYKIDPADPNTATNFFNGFPDFGADNILIPDTVGRVLDCLGRKFTKEKVAEEVLEYLLELEAKRNAAADDLLSIVASREVVDEV